MKYSIKNKMKLIISILLICICMCCVGCVTVDNKIVEIEEQNDTLYAHNMTKIDVVVPGYMENGVYRFEDTELNATCWFVIKDGYGSHAGTVSCISNSQLDV